MGDPILLQERVLLVPKIDLDPSIMYMSVFTISYDCLKFNIYMSDKSFEQLGNHNVSVSLYAL